MCTYLPLDIVTCKLVASFVVSRVASFFAICKKLFKKLYAKNQ